MALYLIWDISLILALASLGTMCVLIVRRLIVEQTERRRQARQKVLRGLIFECLENPKDSCDLRDRLTEDDKQEIRDMVEDLVYMVRGPARDTLLRMITDLGGFENLCRVLESGSAEPRPHSGAVAVDWFLPPGWGTEEHRLRAVSGLALFHDPRAIEALKVGLTDRSPRVRLAAAQALVDLEAVDSVGELIGRLDIGDEIRSRGMREMFRDLAPSHVVEMTDLLDSDISDTVKTLLLYGLAGTRDPFLLPAVMGQFTSPSVDVRAEAMRALTIIGHPGAKPTVLAGLGDESWIVRAQAAIAAGTIGILEAFPPLVDLLDDGNWWVRFRAAQALARLGREGRAILEKMTREAGPAREIATAVLAEVRDTG